MSALGDANAKKEEEEEEEEEELCIVCCDPIRYYAIGECNHTVCCSVCTMRLRILFGDRTCVLCKHEQDRVVVCRDTHRKYADFQIYGDVAGGLIFDDVSNCFFDNKEHHDEMLALRQTACSEGKCRSNVRRFANVGFLDKHLKKDHRLSVCKLCAEAKRMFPAELPRFSVKQLDKHIKQGDPATGFPGHPLCRFCNTRYFNDADLFKHLNQDHFSCDLCDRASPDDNQYYKDYKSLERHFRSRHFLCKEA